MCFREDEGYCENYVLAKGLNSYNVSRLNLLRMFDDGAFEPMGSLDRCTRDKITQSLGHSLTLHLSLFPTPLA